MWIVEIECECLFGCVGCSVLECMWIFVGGLVWFVVGYL